MAGQTPSTPPTFGATGGSSLFGSSPMFGQSQASSSLFGTPQQPLFGQSQSSPVFGQPSPSLFGSTGSSMFGSSTLFGQSQGSPSVFGTPQQQPAFGQTHSTLGQTPSLFGSAGSSSMFGSNMFGQSQVSPSAFGTPQQQPLFGQTQPSFGATPSLFGSTGSSSMFGSSTMFGQSQGSPSIFGTPQQQSLFGQTQSPSNFAQTWQTPQQSMFNNGQLTTQMAPVAPLVVPLPEREIQALFEAYREDPSNLRYAFKHLLLSVTDATLRLKPNGVSDIMWAEALSKLEAMESSDRERLWPELVLGFKDLSKRLQLQDEAIASDVQRLQATESSVKLLQRHYQVDTVPWIQRLRLKQQELQRRLLRMARVMEALEAKGLRMPLTRAEAQLGERLRLLARQLQSTRRVETLLSTSRLHAGLGGCSLNMLTGIVDEESLVSVQEVLKKQTEAISRLTSVLKRDIRDIEIMTDDADRFLGVDFNSRIKSNGSSYPFL